MSGWRRLTSAGVDLVTSVLSGVPENGWMAAGETWTYASADAPSYTFTAPGDLTSKYTAGMKIKLTQTTDKFFILTKVAHSAGTTTFTVYGGTDYVLANATITTPFYSVVKAPAGFPLDPTKWTETYSSTADSTQATPVNGTWYNLGTAKLSVPIGAWLVRYQATVDDVSTLTGVTVRPEVTLSTANNTESDDKWTTTPWQLANTGQTGRAIGTMISEHHIVLTAKADYFLNARANEGSAANIDFRGDLMKTTIRAVCAYL